MKYVRGNSYDVVAVPFSPICAPEMIGQHDALHRQPIGKLDSPWFYNVDRGRPNWQVHLGCTSLLSMARAWMRHLSTRQNDVAATFQVADN